MLGLLEAQTPAAIGEIDLRRQIDRAVGRALVDPGYAAALLADPTIALGQAGCTPYQHRALRSIRAQNLEHFAAEALACFWPSAPTSVQERPHLPHAAGL